jgi:hypothetical protein
VYFSFVEKGREIGNRRRRIKVVCWRIVDIAVEREEQVKAAQCAGYAAYGSWR